MEETTIPYKKQTENNISFQKWKKAFITDEKQFVNKKILNII